MQRTNIFEMHRYTSELKGRFHEMPVGDPMSGAPYGEYLKSKALGMIIGVVAAVVTMGAAVPLLASTVLATQIMGGVMMAGGVMSGVGAVTGNKKLAKIGGILSLAGGVGALASGAANAAGAGGAFASGSGSEAVSSMANSFMDSASSMTGGLVYGDRVAGAAGEAAAGDFAGGSEATTTPVVDAQAQVGELPLDATGTPSQIDPANISNGPPVTDAAGSQIDPANISNGPPTAQAAPSTGGQLDLATTPSGSGSQIDPANITNDSPAAWKDSLATKDQGIFAKANSFIGDNKELLKTGASALEMGMKAGMGGDAADAATQEALAKAKVYDAQASLLTTQNAQAQFTLANQNKKSVMISANDPQLEAKLAAAQASGAAVGIIPAIGAGGVKQTGNTAFTTAANAAPQGQQVVRQATYAQPTTGILAKAA